MELPRSNQASFFRKQNMELLVNPVNQLDKTVIEFKKGLKKLTKENTHYFVLEDNDEQLPKGYKFDKQGAGGFFKKYFWMTASKKGKQTLAVRMSLFHITDDCDEKTIETEQSIS